MKKATTTIDVSCGTLVVDATGRLLLGHVTHTPRWDIPKGLLDPGETTLEAAMRELREEMGLEFPPEAFRELADYRMLAFGAGMVVIMLWRPRGLLAHRDPTILLHGGKTPAGAAK